MEVCAKEKKRLFFVYANVQRDPPRKQSRFDRIASKSRLCPPDSRGDGRHRRRSRGDHGDAGGEGGGEELIRRVPCQLLLRRQRQARPRHRPAAVRRRRALRGARHLLLARADQRVGLLRAVRRLLHARVLLHLAPRPPLNQGDGSQPRPYLRLVASR